MSIPMPERMRLTYNNPGFWSGVLTVRQADLMAADNEPSSGVAWLGEAVQRAITLFDIARAGEIDVTTTPEFERWHSPSGFVSRSLILPCEDDLDIPSMNRNERTSYR